MSLVYYNMFRTMLAFPTFVKIMWAVLLIQLIFWVIPFSRCVIYGLGTGNCWTILSIRTALLFIVSLPIVFYITNSEYLKITGKELASLPFPGMRTSNNNSAPKKTIRSPVQRDIPISNFEDAKIA